MKVAADEKAAPARANLRSLRRAISTLGVLQIDAVNAVARSQLLVLRPRLAGVVDSTQALLYRAAYAADNRLLTEYWCHEACFCATQDWPLYRWRMRRAEAGETWKPMAEFAAENSQAINALLTELERHGPVSVAELEAATGVTSRPPKRQGAWAQWSHTKLALGWLFWTGYVGVAERVNFTRRYDLIDRVLPAAVVDKHIDEHEAQRELLLQAAQCLGVATVADLGDYHRLPKREAPARVAELVEDGKLLVANVEGWSQDGYLLPTAKAVRSQSQSVLLSPFDPLVWFRPRAERLFHFNYRLEIYTPAAKRRYGYYVLPFLHEDRLAARVDVRADRKDQVLRVLGAFAEPDATGPNATGSHATGTAAGGGASSAAANSQTPVEVALAKELTAMSQWLGLDDVAIASDARGDLAKPLQRVLKTGR